MTCSIIAFDNAPPGGSASGAWELAARETNSAQVKINPVQSNDDKWYLPKGKQNIPLGTEQP